MNALPDTFWSKVNKNGPIIRAELGPCWIWTGATNPKGYGNMTFQGKWTRPHRVAWMAAHGPISSDIHVLHRCDNPPCVNEAHMFTVTNLDNRHDMFAKGRHPHGPTHGNAKLSWAQVHEARVRHVLGESAYSLAREFGITGVQMLDVVNCRSYMQDRAA